MCLGLFGYHETRGVLSAIFTSAKYATFAVLASLFYENTMNKKLSACVATLLCVVGALPGKAHDTSGGYRYVEIEGSREHVAKAAAACGVDLVCGSVRTARGVRVYVDSVAYAALRTYSAVALHDLELPSARVLPADLRDLKIASDPQDFTLGSWRGFKTAEEIIQDFSQMRAKYPSLVGPPIQIGTTHEQRPIFAYEIGENTANRALPAVLLTALHHAREPGSAMSLLYSLHALLEEYAADSAEARYLLRNRRIIVVPILNPDGYAYNYLTQPSGGGLWRKNRVPNDDGTYGVDINRNYGPAWLWNHPNQGSSADPRLDTYRGKQPFSEAETRAMRLLSEQYGFRTALNFHTYGDLLVRPGLSVSPGSAAENLIVAAGSWIARGNRLSFGLDTETVGYGTRGTSDDFLFADRGTLSYTPEAGSAVYGFWPPADEIFAIVRLQKRSVYGVLWAAGGNAVPGAPFRSDGAGGMYDILVPFENAGFDTVVTSAPMLSSRDGGIRVRADLSFPSSLASGASALARFRVPVSANREWVVEWDNGGCFRRDSFSLLAGASGHVEMLPGDSRWVLNGWSVRDDAGTMILDDSPGDISADGVWVAQWGEDIDLGGAVAADLTVDLRWWVQRNIDWLTVEARRPGGSWQKLRMPMMREGTLIFGAEQVPGEYGFDGCYPLWLRQTVSLDEFAGGPVQIRFVLAVSNRDALDGVNIRRAEVRTWDAAALSAGEVPEPFAVVPAPNPVSGGVVTLRGLAPESVAALRAYSSDGRSLPVRWDIVGGEVRLYFDVPFSGSYYVQVRDAAGGVATVSGVRQQ